MRISIEAILLEANMRGKAANKPAFVWQVGLGLGVWAVEKSAQTRVIF